MNALEQRKRRSKLSAENTRQSLMPEPRRDELPTLYADRVGEWCVAERSLGHRRRNGLYLTPVLVADFMAGQIQATGEHLRILDPAAGAGILACAAVEALVSRFIKPEIVEIVAFEIDIGLIPALSSVLDYLTAWCRIHHGVVLKFRVEPQDFILANSEALGQFGGPDPRRGNDVDFDVVISNPPYFKINIADPRAVASASVVHGQPNIYGIFMAVSAAILRPGGDFIFIVPRSFASGSYFRQFRSVFFNMIRPTEIHVFCSRRDTFSRDDVLQENIIFSGTRANHWYTRQPNSKLAISSSRGARDIGDSNRRVLSMPASLDLKTTDKVLKLPLTDEDDAVLALVSSWPNNLHALGLNISTGPVVPFRAKELVSHDGKVPRDHVPLLWMHHVKPMALTWPLFRHLPQFIRRSDAESLLIPNNNYVLLRRFSTKEQARRLIAAPYLAGDFEVPEIGLENHLNYIHRPRGSLTEDEAWGLAALYNSRLLDIYFRAINGNTQVSATELRAMPLPSIETIINFGRLVKNRPGPLDGLEEIVMQLVAQQDEKEASLVKTLDFSKIPCKPRARALFDQSESGRGFPKSIKSGSTRADFRHILQAMNRSTLIE